MLAPSNFKINVSYPTSLKREKNKLSNDTKINYDLYLKKCKFMLYLVKYAILKKFTAAIL